GGATIAVIGLVLRVVSLGGRRRDEEADAPIEEAPDTADDEAAAPVAAGAAGADAGAEPRTEGAASPTAQSEDADIDRLFAADPPAAETRAADDRAEPIDAVVDEDRRCPATTSTPVRGRNSR